MTTVYDLLPSLSDEEKFRLAEHILGEINKPKLPIRKGDWRELFGRRRPKGHEPQRMPAIDHAFILLEDDVPVKYVSQPYSIDLHELEEIVKLCNSTNLNVRITGGSWHAGCRTVRLEFSNENPFTSGRL